MLPLGALWRQIWWVRTVLLKLYSGNVQTQISGYKVIMGTDWCQTMINFTPSLICFPAPTMVKTSALHSSSAVMARYQSRIQSYKPRIEKDDDFDMQRCTVMMGRTKLLSSASTAQTQDSLAACSGADRCKSLPCVWHLPVCRCVKTHSIGATGELIATTMQMRLPWLAITVHTPLSSDALSRESRCSQHISILSFSDIWSKTVVPVLSDC